MNKQQAGFTLIELVMVIVILGILAATALPKFVDLSEEAEIAATEGVAGSAASASAINYAACAAVNHDNTNAKCTSVTDCADIEALIDGVTFGTAVGNYDITAGAINAGTTNGLSGSCNMTYKSSATVTRTVAFTAIEAGQ